MSVKLYDEEHTSSMLTILVESHAAVSDLKHVEIVPAAVACLLPEGRRKVDDASHGAV